MKAIILAGSFSTRFYPLIKVTPKQLKSPYGYYLLRIAEDRVVSIR